MTRANESTTCTHCGAPAEQGPYREAVCLACAIRLGAQEAHDRNAHGGGKQT